MVSGGCGREAVSPAPASDPAARAAAWLWKQQREDGSWRSETYGLLKPGLSLTPFVLGALLGAGGSAPARSDERARRFLAEKTASDGALGCADLTAYDYPVYATSLAVLASPAGPDRERGVAWLRVQQFTEANGWKREDPAYGGWGMGGPIREAPHPGHLDISKSRYALEALRAGGAADGDPAFEKARVFLGRCQDEGSGGFWFSPVILDANKAGKEGEGFRPYGTATADGILALLACGAKPDEPRLALALRWLRDHHRTDVVPGIPPGVAPYWETAMWFYYLAASSRVFARLGGPDGWRERLRAVLATAQHPDGSYKADNPMMREDDPLIATSLAVLALAAASRR